MLEPIDIAMDKNGRVFMGRVEYKDGEPISAIEAEMTSQGAYTDGLDARKLISGAYSCHLMPSNERPYIKPIYEKSEDMSLPIVNIKNNSEAGFKYLNFGESSPSKLIAYIKGLAKGYAEVMIDSPNGDIIAKIEFDKSDDYAEYSVKLEKEVTGKHAAYFKFNSESDEYICEFDAFGFVD